MRVRKRWEETVEIENEEDVEKSNNIHTLIPFSTVSVGHTLRKQKGSPLLS